MIKSAFRAVGIWAIVTGIFYLIIDIWRSVTTVSISIRSLGQAWVEVSSTSIIATEVFFSNILGSPEVWQFIAGNILRFIPAFIFLFAIGLLLNWLGGSKKPKEKTEKPLAAQFGG